MESDKMKKTTIKTIKTIITIAFILGIGFIVGKVTTLNAPPFYTGEKDSFMVEDANFLADSLANICYSELAKRGTILHSPAQLCRAEISGRNIQLNYGIYYADIACNCEGINYHINR